MVRGRFLLKKKKEKKAGFLNLSVSTNQIRTQTRIYTRAPTRIVLFVSDVSFIRGLFQRTTSLWRMNEVLHVLKMKYFIRELFKRFLLRLLYLVHFVHYCGTLVQSRLRVVELR